MYYTILLSFRNYQVYFVYDVEMGFKILKAKRKKWNCIDEKKQLRLYFPFILQFSIRAEDW